MTVIFSGNYIEKATHKYDINELTSGGIIFYNIGTYRYHIMGFSYSVWKFVKLIWKGNRIIVRLLILILVRQLYFVSMREMNSDFVT